MQNILNYIHKRKYELLLFALIQHLFIGIFLNDLPFYTKIIWPINMVILGIASVGVFIEKGRWKNIIQNILFLLVLVLPIGLTFWGNNPNYFIFLNFGYVVFFLFIFCWSTVWLLFNCTIIRSILCKLYCESRN